MCWGFSHGDGWEPIIRRLAEKVEPIIQQWIDDNPFADCDCGCKKEKHVFKKCETIFNRGLWTKGCRPKYAMAPTWMIALRPRWLNRLVDRFWRKFYTKILYPFRVRRDKIMWWLCYRGILYREDPCPCREYNPQHPRASQVKEKFGTLRFYMDHGCEEIWQHISQAERESAVTCEDCGAYGEIREGGWIRTLCNDCEKRYQETRDRRL
jgi:hypothetical protein